MGVVETKQQTNIMTTQNTTALKFRKGDIVRSIGPTKNAKRGIIICSVSPFGTSGEYSYYIYWYGVGEGSGWTDYDLRLA